MHYENGFDSCGGIVDLPSEMETNVETILPSQNGDSYNVCGDLDLMNIIQSIENTISSQGDKNCFPSSGALPINSSQHVKAANQYQDSSNGTLITTNSNDSNSVGDSVETRVRPNGLLAKLGVPCQTSADYDYGNCYSYYANGCYNTCQFVQMGDMEDFMNNEKRKEKSRDAARCRRSKETEIFTDLAKALPLTNEQISQLDKASVMRLAIAYLKVREMVDLVPALEKSEKCESHDESILLKSLEGFIIVLSNDGDFIYLSENVSNYLGISQIDLMGQNVFEFSHPCDHDEIRDAISGKSQDEFNIPRSIFIRLKCTLTNKGRSVNLKSATYKVIHCTGHMLKSLNIKTEADERSTKVQSCFIAVGQPIPHPSNIEAPLPKQTFLTKHSLDMKFIHADDEFMKNILGYDQNDLLGKSVYEYHHAMDSDAILAAYKCLFAKGQCETNRYRFLAKRGGYIWVVTQATLIHDKIHKPHSVVSVNYVISGLECKNEIYSAFQIQSVIPEASAKADTTAVVITTDNKENKDSSNLKEEESVVQVKEKEVEQQPPLEKRRPVVSTSRLFGADRGSGPKPRIATREIFGPRTEEMSKGYLMFSEDTPGLTMLKDEPDDLTHLAPVAGDVCVPLDDHPFLADMLDDILLKDNLAPLLADEPTDPFIAYREQEPSPQLLSPNMSKTSDSLPSLGSPSDSLLDEDQMSTFMNLQMDDETGDMTLRAPYIPMDIADDLPLLMSNDLMWSSNEKKQLPDNNSSLAQLLSSSMNKHGLKANEHGGGGGLVVVEEDLDRMFGDKNDKTKSWTTQNNLKNTSLNNQRTERVQSIKRSSPSTYDTQNKRPKNEPKEKMSSELLQQLMSNNHHRGRPKGKSNWLLDSGGQKAACISQPSDSVLMNLLDPPFSSAMLKPRVTPADILMRQKRKRKLELERDKRNVMRKNSLSLLEPEANCLASFMDLTQHDYEVNAPVNDYLLQGEELLTALDINTAI